MAQSRESKTQWRIVIGSDDAGLDYKTELNNYLVNDPRVEMVIDVGIDAEEHTIYPNIAATAAHTIIDGRADRGLLFCGTGLGMAISANKIHGIRAVTADDLYSVQRSVLSNDAQVLCMGQRVVGLELAKSLVNVWLDLEFDPSSHSAKNVAGICALEESDDC